MRAQQSRKAVVIGAVAPSLFLLGLLAPVASAQVGSREQPKVSAEVAARAAGFEAGYLVGFYVAHFASTSVTPSQGDIEEATRLYFTNGAAATDVASGGIGAAYFLNGAQVTGVPATGPGAAYFQNGAAVLSATPTATPAGETASSAPLSVATPEYEEARQAGPREGAVRTAVAAPLSPQRQSAAVAASDLTCSPRELEAAMAFARQFAIAVEADTPPAEPGSVPATDAPAAEAIPDPACAPVVSPAPSPPIVGCQPSPDARFLPAAIGAILGGLSVALWSRPRARRLG